MHTGSCRCLSDLRVLTTGAASETPAHQRQQLTGSTMHNTHLCIARSPPSSLQLPSTCVLRLGTRLGTPILSGLLPCLHRGRNRRSATSRVCPFNSAHHSSRSPGISFHVTVIPCTYQDVAAPRPQPSGRAWVQHQAKSGGRGRARQAASHCFRHGAACLTRQYQGWHVLPWISRARAQVQSSAAQHSYL